jgi:DNA repair exonuclease SbcCD ATPase subunit
MPRKDNRGPFLIKSPFSSTGTGPDALEKLIEQLQGEHVHSIQNPIRIDNLTRGVMEELTPESVRQYLEDHPNDEIMMSGTAIVPISPLETPLERDRVLRKFGPPPKPPEMPPEPILTPPPRPEPPPDDRELDRLAGEQVRRLDIEDERMRIALEEDARAQRIAFAERERQIREEERARAAQELQAARELQAERERAARELQAERERAARELREAQERIRELEAQARIREAEQRAALAEERLKAAEERASKAETKAEAIAEARGIAATARRAIDGILGIFRRRR